VGDAEGMDCGCFQRGAVHHARVSLALRSQMLALVPHQVQRPHVFNEDVLVLRPPVYDRTIFLDACSPIHDGYDGPVADERIVDSEQILAPPYRLAKGVLSNAAYLHHGEH
jgi:hypothetical protein